MILKYPVHLASASSFLVLLWMALSAPAAADAVTVRQLETTEDLCERCSPGDYLASNGVLEIVVGASHRADESFYKFATADSLGSIVFARPVGSGIRGDI
ncbi:MAG: hypothetical protein OEM63_05755, partial [Gammaproteobacteria bacterium]|nr:hypothetical protein [Gammaproteobacteria bacterium]